MNFAFLLKICYIKIKTICYMCKAMSSNGNIACLCLFIYLFIYSWFVSCSKSAVLHGTMFSEQWIERMQKEPDIL
jgi:hypothetical protein